MNVHLVTDCFSYKIQNGFGLRVKEIFYETISHGHDTKYMNIQQKEKL